MRARQALFFAVLTTGAAFAAGCDPRCEADGRFYTPGQTFPAGDGCNSCSCTSTGVACTLIACQRQDGGVADAGTCGFSSTYTYGYRDGDTAHEATSTLSPQNEFKHERRWFSGPTKSCAPPMPTCGALDVITAYDVEVHDLKHPDVVAALAQPTPPFYGHDRRPVDGSVFVFKRADGRGFVVGDRCPTGISSCQAIPPGIAQITERLLDLDAQQLAHPSCAQTQQR